ncbi:MAG: LysR substrate-binding domain-containing protein [Actinomycetota bacterium]|nr:LysR substrate-binding domain-containing protein [Actinomycetota bacterium]
MTLGQLRTFLALAATGSARAAAERLVVTQPAVSAVIASLQQEVGVPLVAREGRGLRLTAAGDAFADYARRALGLLDEGMAAAVGAAQPERGRVRLAAVTSAGEHLAPSLLASFVTRHPGVDVSLEVGNRRRVWDLLAHHEADVAIGGRPPATANTLATRPHQLVLVAVHPGGGNRSKLRSATRSVSLDELAQATWLLRESGSGTRASAEELLGQLDVAPRVLTLGSNGAIVESVRIGLGITLISRDAVDEYLLNGALEEWRYGPLPLERAWHLVRAANKPLAATHQLFLDHLIASGWRRA